MEEIGYRTTPFDYEGIGAERRDYVAWLLGACAAERSQTPNEQSLGCRQTQVREKEFCGPRLATKMG